MTNDEIKLMVAKELTALTDAHEAVTNIENNIKYLQKQCPHTETQTHDDGSTPDAKVIECLICGYCRKKSPQYSFTFPTLVIL
jgi:ferredoxin-like protein FixX